MRRNGLVWNSQSYLTKFVEFGKQHAKVCGFFLSRALSEEAQDALMWNSMSYVTNCVNFRSCETKCAEFRELRDKVPEFLNATRQSVWNFEGCVTKCLNF